MKYGVGIDVSKGKSTIAVLSVAGELIVEPFEINHDVVGLKLLEEKIKDIPNEDLKIVMEETGIIRENKRLVIFTTGTTIMIQQQTMVKVP